MTTLTNSKTISGQVPILFTRTNTGFPQRKKIIKQLINRLTTTTSRSMLLTKARFIWILWGGFMSHDNTFAYSKMYSI